MVGERVPVGGGGCQPGVDSHRRYSAEGGAPGEPRDWRPAALQYRAAVAVLPSCGNAYSQLAVLST